MLLADSEKTQTRSCYQQSVLDSHGSCQFCADWEAKDRGSPLLYNVRRGDQGRSLSRHLVTMKLLLFVCVCALAAAEPEHPEVPSTPQLTGILTNLYRRFLHTVAPKQLELQDALHIQFREGKMAGPRFVSPVSSISRI